MTTPVTLKHCTSRNFNWAIIAPPPPFPANPLLVILMVVNGGQAAMTEVSTTQSETSLLNL